MKKILFYFLAVIIIAFSRPLHSMASHIAGHDVTYTLVDSSAGIYHYRVYFSLYVDCTHLGAVAIDTTETVALYNGTGTLVNLDTAVYCFSTATMPVTSNITCSGIATDPSFCRLRKLYFKDYFLPASSSGYVIEIQRCCINWVNNINNPGETGMTAFCMIPAAGIASSNNSAIFHNYPPLIVAINRPIEFNFSATDTDGDSLSYEICAGYSGADISDTKPIPTPPPFTEYSYYSPLSYSNPMSCSVPLQIDPVTGILSGTPNIEGSYLITVCCHEWRNGVLINTTRRFFEFLVANCTTAVGNLPKDAICDVKPNPVTDELTITSSAPIHEISITNLFGTLVYNGIYDKQEVMINTSQLPPGVYVARINGMEVHKFIKQ